MRKCLERLRCLEGQPARFFTDDGRKHVGIVLEVFEDFVRIIDTCGRLFIIEACHIDAIEEPQMRLHCCCGKFSVSEGCGNKCDEDEDCDRDHDKC